MQCILTGDSTVAVVSLEEIKARLEITRTDQDTMLQSMEIGARLWCENYTHRAFLEQTFTLTLDSFQSYIRVPRPRLRSVDSIVYYDTNADTLTGAGGQPVSSPQLYNLSADISEAKDLAAAMPEKVSQLQKKWDTWNKGNADPLWGGGGGGEGKGKRAKKAKEE